jgi:hypothetical protein
MTGLNHAATGALIATAINRPALALPLAFLSHFAVDMIPHWDYKYKSASPLGFATRVTDLALSLLLLTLLSLKAGSLWVFLGGILAISPDFMWWNFFLHGKPDRRDGNNPLHILRRFHIWIQWSESRWGLLVEVIWFPLILWLIFQNIG